MMGIARKESIFRRDGRNLSKILLPVDEMQTMLMLNQNKQNALGDCGTAVFAKICK